MPTNVWLFSCHFDDILQSLQVSKSLEHEALVFIPVPPSQPGYKDHAFYLAWYLSEIWQAPYLNPLSKSSRRIQKSKSRRERLQIEINCRSGWSSWGRKVILVDDVVSTGATAEGCKKALSSPARLELWALAYRPKKSITLRTCIAK